MEPEVTKWQLKSRGQGTCSSSVGQMRFGHENTKSCAYLDSWLALALQICFPAAVLIYPSPLPSSDPPYPRHFYTNTSATNISLVIFHKCKHFPSFFLVWHFFSCACSPSYIFLHHSKVTTNVYVDSWVSSSPCTLHFLTQMRINSVQLLPEKFFLLCSLTHSSSDHKRHQIGTHDSQIKSFNGKTVCEKTILTLLCFFVCGSTYPIDEVPSSIFSMIRSPSVNNNRIKSVWRQMQSEMMNSADLFCIPFSFSHQPRRKVKKVSKVKAKLCHKQPKTFKGCFYETTCQVFEEGACVGIWKLSKFPRCSWMFKIQMAWLC